MGKKSQQLPKLQIIGAEEPAAPVARPAPVQPSMSFDAWWLMTQSSRGLSAALKESLRKHMEARGFLANGQYEEGLKDFGIG